MEKEVLYRFFGGEATVDEEKQVLDWFDADPAHQMQLFAERRIFDAMLLHAQPQAAPKSKTFALSRWTREATQYAAVVALTLGLGAGYVSYRDKQFLQASNTISVPAGQRVDVTLPDGTKVCMNALSELKYPAAFAGSKRQVQLKGEAFFEVTHDNGHPFVVETYACNVEVLGTKFNVEARAESKEFVASLVEGKVRVTDRSNENNRVEITPNQRATYLDGQLIVGEIPEFEGFQWREGVIAFRDASFLELIGEFEKYYGVKIDIQRRNITPSLFTGKIRISEGVDHALWVLQRSANFRITRNETKDIIYIQ